MDNKNKDMGFLTAMTKTGRSLKRWEKNRLISHEQLLSILAFERQRGRKNMVFTVTGLAIFAIGLGVLSIVGANILYISGTMKIILHLLLNGTVATALWFSDKNNKKIWREGLTLLFFALNMTLIALIGQVYQLSGDYATALSLWLAVSTPAILIYGKTAMSAISWTIAFLTTYVLVVDKISGIGSDWWIYWLLGGESNSNFREFIISLALVLYTPLALIAAGNIEKLRTARPEWSHSLIYSGMLILLTIGTCGSLYWYNNRPIIEAMLIENNISATNYAITFMVIAGTLPLIYIFRHIKEKRGNADKSALLFVTASIISATFPILFMTGHTPIMGAIHFITYWIFVGWIGYRTNHDRLISTAITMVAIRIIWIYLELFGSMLTTGIGLIISGILVLIFLRLVLKLNKRIKSPKKMEAPE